MRELAHQIGFVICCYSKASNNSRQITLADGYKTGQLTQRLILKLHSLLLHFAFELAPLHCL